MLTQSSSGVPSAQSRMWSIAAEAAEAADEEPRALMTAAPRCCTVGMNSSRYQARVHQRLRRLAADGAVRDVGMLRRAVVAPDDHAADLAHVRAGLGRELPERAIVVEPHHRGEIAPLDAGRVRRGDQRIRVRGIADDQHAHVAVRGGVERLALGREDLRIREQQVLALHAGAARARADQQRVVAVLERLLRVVGRDHAGERREGAVRQFHHDAGQRRQRGRDFEQVQVDRLVGAEHLPGGDAEGERIADMAGGAGDGDGDGWLHQDSGCGRGSRGRNCSSGARVQARRTRRRGRDEEEFIIGP